MTNHITVGSVVRVTDARTPIEGFPVGSAKSQYVGARGTVRSVHFEGTDVVSAEVDFENGDLSSLGSWSFPALDLLHPAPGALVKVTSEGTDPNYGGHGFAAGETVRRSTKVATGGDAAYEHLDGSDYWFLQSTEFEILEPEVEEEAPTRPLIDFSGASRATARDYASRHISKVNKTETNDVLHAVSRGEKVDAYALNEALLDAMRGATTRAARSTERREQGTEIAHIGHIVQAVLESHADQLPAYAEGDRSRAVEAAKEGIREAQAEVERLTARVEEALLQRDQNATALREAQAERSTLAQAASDERRRLVAEIEGLKGERDTLASVLAYALDRSTDRVAQRVLGFWDGLK